MNESPYKELASRDKALLPAAWLAKGIAAAAKDLTKELTKHALPASMGLLVATPITAVFGVAVELLVGKLFEQNKELHAELRTKIDVVLAEPLTTARKQLTDIVRIKTADARTLAQVDRQLNVAYDTLLKALSYAEEKDWQSRLTITAYLALVAAMMDGGKEFAHLHIDALREAARRVALESERLETERARLEKLADEYHQKMERSESMPDWSFDGRISTQQRLTGIYATQAWSYRREADGLKRALDEMKDVPTNIETYCRFLQPITEDRRSVFSPKGPAG